MKSSESVWRLMPRKWNHLALMLPRLHFRHRENIAVIEIMTSYLRDPSSIVKTCVMQAFTEIAEADGQLRPALVAKIQALTGTGKPAMQARGRKLINRLKLKTG